MTLRRVLPRALLASAASCRARHAKIAFLAACSRRSPAIALPPASRLSPTSTPETCLRPAKRPSSPRLSSSARPSSTRAPTRQRSVAPTWSSGDAAERRAFNCRAHMMRGQHSVAVPYPHVNSWTVRNLAASLSRATEVHSRTAGKRQADSPEVSLVKDGVKKCQEWFRAQLTGHNSFL